MAGSGRLCVMFCRDQSRTDGHFLSIGKIRQTVRHTPKGERNVWLAVGSNTRPVGDPSWARHDEMETGSGHTGTGYGLVLGDSLGSVVVLDCPVVLGCPSHRGVRCHHEQFRDPRDTRDVQDVQQESYGVRVRNSLRNRAHHVAACVRRLFEHLGYSHGAR